MVSIAVGAAVSSRTTVRVASVPANHPYVHHLSAPAGDADDVVRLPDPTVDGAPADQWWPPVMLRPDWVRRHAGDFDVFHLHFGFDDCTADELRALVATLRSVRRPLVLTVHDLRNPHHHDPARHRAALDVLVPAADAVVTLTCGAAREIAVRWSRDATVIPHPHVVPLSTVDRHRSPTRPDDFVIGLHAKSVRANSDPVRVALALASVVEPMAGVHLRVDAHDDPRGRAVAELLPGIDVRVHRRFTDEEMWAYLSGLDASVLPYRFGTHSGWLEACHDLGTTVIAPDVGHYAEQAPCLVYALREDGPDPVSLTAAVHVARSLPSAWRADPGDRRRQRQAIAAAHERLYRTVLADEADAR